MAMNPSLYENDRERSRHQATIELLAQEQGLPLNEVEAVYEAELARLKVGARIKDFLTVLTSRRVKGAIGSRPVPSTRAAEAPAR